MCVNMRHLMIPGTSPTTIFVKRPIFLMRNYRCWLQLFILSREIFISREQGLSFIFDVKIKWIFCISLIYFLHEAQLSRINCRGSIVESSTVVSPILMNHLFMLSLTIMRQCQKMWLTLILSNSSLTWRDDDSTKSSKYLLCCTIMN